MKLFVVFALALLALAPARAQILRPEAASGALLGGVAGAVIGNNSGDLRHNAWRGAALGAGAGLLLGTMVGDANDRHGTQVTVADYPRTYVYRDAPVYYRASIHNGHHWSHRRHAYRGYGGYYHRPVYYGNAGYYGDVVYDGNLSGRSDYRGSGLLLGALAGAVIGHNSGDLRHNGWRGAAYGAGLGYILGSVAERNARQREAAESFPTATPTHAVAETVSVADSNARPAPSAPATPASPPARASSMSAANSLFGRK